MSIFEEMLDMGKRQEFLEYRESRNRNDYRIQGMKEYLLSDCYEDDVKKLACGDYHLSIPVKKGIPKGFTDRKRIVYHFAKNEMSLLRMMSFVLHDYEDIIPGDVYSFKKGICAKDLVWKISRSCALRNMYVVKADVVSYGNSINAECLIRMIHDIFADRDPQANAFFTWLLRRRVFIVDGVLTEGNTSALPGIPIHNFFTNLYLADMDRKLSPHCELYARYSDDIIMFQRTRTEAERNMHLLFSELKAHGLTPHDDEKTGIYDPGSPYDFLGFSFAGNNVDISRTSLKKLKRRMRIRAKRTGLDRDRRFKTPAEKAKHLIQLNRKTFFGRPASDDLCWSQWAFPVITGTGCLHELDLYNQQCIRYVITGKWSDAGYRVKYSQLKELGYESLVRAYHASKDITEDDN